MNLKYLSFTVFCSLSAGVANLSATAVNVYLSAPYTQKAADQGATTGGGQSNTVNELFESYSTSTFTTLNSTGISGATYTSTKGTSAINANGQYGGGLQGKYLGIGNGDSVTLRLATPVNYLGLEWCAVDGGNSLTLYHQNNLAIGTFNANTFSSILPNNTTSTITAIDGTAYHTQDYFGRPTGNAATTTNISNRANKGQQYAYLNFIAQSGTQISKVVFSETGAVFENDNHTILTTTPVVLGSYVYLGTVPEPSTVAMLLAGAGALGFTHRLRRPRA